MNPTSGLDALEMSKDTCFTETHVRVVPAYTGVFSVSHTTHPTHHNPPQPPHHTETDTERDRDKERRGDEREEDREDKTTEERTEKIHFQCGGEWPFFVDVVISG